MNEERPDRAFRNMLLIILSVQLTLLFTRDASSTLYPEMVFFFSLRGCSDVLSTGIWPGVCLLGCRFSLCGRTTVHQTSLYVSQLPVACGGARYPPCRLVIGAFGRVSVTSEYQSSYSGLLKKP